VAVRGGYASLYDVSPDWQPILGEVPGIEGLFVAAGFSGHGFKLSPAVGEAMAGLIAEGGFDAIDLRPFRLSRFAEGALIHSAYTHGIVG
jgi:glycine/D-amino acid oxidase-like deaminating enzyme